MVTHVLSLIMGLSLYALTVSIDTSMKDCTDESVRLYNKALTTLATVVITLATVQFFEPSTSEGVSLKFKILSIMLGTIIFALGLMLVVKSRKECGSLRLPAVLILVLGLLLISIAGFSLR